MQTKLVTSTTPQQFDTDLNEELKNLSSRSIIEVKFSTAQTQFPDENAPEWDTIYSALIIYKD